MSEPLLTFPSRRDFLRTSGGAIGWMTLAARFPAAAQAAREARRIAAGELPSSFLFLSSEEAAQVEEIAALIIPTDTTPGAREAGAVYFVDRALGDFMAPIAGEFRAGLEDFTRRLAKTHPGTTSVTDLGLADAHAFLKSVEHTQFFNQCWMLTVWGTLADPAHGGNRNETGWRMIGFEDRHAWQPPFGFYDADAHGRDR
jgi:gluconate 2-dehydrogenase gamma chain